MVSRKFSRRLAAAATCGAMLGGCTSAAVQTPTLSYLDINGGRIEHPDYELVQTETEASNWGAHSEGSKVSNAYGLLFSPMENTDRFGVANAYYLHPLPYNLKDYAVLAQRWGASTKDGAAPSAWQDAEFRNFVQNDLLRRSDQICTAYQARLINGFVVGQSVADGAGALVKILAAPLDALNTTFSATLNTASFQFSSDFLKWQTFQAAHTRIVHSRRNLRNLMRSAQQLPAKEYSVSQAVYDAERYHSYCNITMAYVGGDGWTGKETNEQILPKRTAAAKNPKTGEVEPADRKALALPSQEDASAKAP